MSHFYGTLQGTSGIKTTCTGTKKSGMETHCASWKGAVRCRAYVNDEGKDWVTVEKIRWEGAGETRVLYDGPIGEEKP